MSTMVCLRCLKPCGRENIMIQSLSGVNTN